ncbi:MAG: methionine--tRNA ligase [Bacilli bacterium]|nr:methionine--tRNA ligase [Bacilli bacterium]
MKKTFYITTAIDYTSQKPHIGNNYEKVLADVMARFKRLDGFDVLYQTGTDEHGLKVKEKAKEAKIEPKDYVDKISKEMKNLLDLLNVSYDKFVRTIDPLHEKKVQEIFEYLYKKGDIYLDKYEGWYCVPCESFFLEKDLEEKKCPDCNREVTYGKEESYFFKLSKYENDLKEYINNNPDFIKPESKKREMINNFLTDGLQDLCVSRSSLDWGIKVSFDPKHVIYVWIDALSNYITFIGHDINGNHDIEYKKYWPANYHIIGKDIVKFHTIYWPILLMALDIPLPKTVYGHPWLTINGGKISKSVGNVIYVDELAKHFEIDQIRYYLIHEVPYQNDGTMNYEILIERINSDLVNTLGNLVSRTNAMIIKYFDGIVPESVNEIEIDRTLKEYAINLKETTSNLIDSCHIAESLDGIIELFRKCNKYIDENEPWVLAKDENQKERLGTILYNLIESIRIGAVLLQAYIPETSEKILNKINASNRSFESLKAFGNYAPGTVIKDATPLFNRINKEEKLKNL